MHQTPWRRITRKYRMKCKEKQACRDDSHDERIRELQADREIGRIAELAPASYTQRNDFKETAANDEQG